MSEKEVRRGGVLARVEAGEVTQVEAAAILGLSYRQTKRLWKQYQQDGAAALVHGNAEKLLTVRSTQSCEGVQAETGAEELPRTGRCVRTDTGGRTSAGGSRHCSGCRNATEMDAGGGAMATGTEAQSLSAAKEAKVALR